MIAQIRRTVYVFFYFQDGKFLDINQLFRGKARSISVKKILAISLLRREEFPITFEELQILFKIPSDRWVPASQIINTFHVDPELIRNLARNGLILSDELDEEFQKLRRRDEQLASTDWNLYAALYHFMAKWPNVSRGIEPPYDIEKMVHSYGRPPEHFYEISNPLRVCDLPMVKKEGGLYEILLRRKTTRAFDPNTPMTLEELSIVLYYVYGCHGYAPRSQDILFLKKTSPSGGCMHPIEVYLLNINIQGLNLGIYHYNIKDHSLELIAELSKDEAAHLVNEFTDGQSFLQSAPALFIMTARFYRNFWKYRRNQKAYEVLLMDAAHLSQTFYLVCTELGLGAFITAAINSTSIENKLALDESEEGTIAVCACGKPSEKNSSLDPEFFPYIPRETKL